MIDIDAVAEFERQFSLVLDTLQQLKKIRALDSSKDEADTARWIRDFQDAMAFMPELPDPDNLTRFAENVTSAISGTDQKAMMAMAMAMRKKQEIVLPQEPVLQWATVLECYDAAGEVWEDTQHHTAGSFAYWCKANPCSQDGNYVDTTTDIYIEFPFAASGTEYPDGLYSFPVMGVIYCPVGTVITYFVRPKPAVTGAGAHPAYVGIEAGHRLGLPLGTNFTEWDAEKGAWVTVELPIFFEAGINNDGSSITFYRRHQCFDPFGRFIRHGVTTTISFMATVDVPAGGGICNVVFSGPEYPPP